MGLRTFLIIAWMLSHVQSLYPCSMKFKTSRRTTLLMAEHGGMLTLEARNRAFLSGLKLEPEVVTMIVQDERMGNVEVEERVKMLREVTGLTRATLKRYLSKYPSMVIEMFTTPVKSSKSVTVRMLGISEAEYVASLHKIGRQTNNKPGTLFRGSLPLIVATLKDPTIVGLSRAQLRQVFLYYPTLYSLDEGYLARRLRHLRNRGYSPDHLKNMLLMNPRSVLYDQRKYQELECFLKKSIGLTTSEFCEVTSRESRLISASFNETVVAKMNHLLDTWGLPKKTLKGLVLVFPTILTTPVGTTSRLWNYLHDSLLMSAEEIRQCAIKYPGFLRSNPESLTRKLEYLVVFQALVKGMVLVHRLDTQTKLGVAKESAHHQDLLSRYGDGTGPGAMFRDESELATAVAHVLRSVAALLVRQNSIIFTFSDARISMRLLEATAVKHPEICREQDVEDGEEEPWREGVGAFRAEILKQKLQDIAAHLRQTKGSHVQSPPWPAPEADSSDMSCVQPSVATHELHVSCTQDTYPRLAQALVSVAGTRPCALLVLEAAQVRDVIGDRGRLSTLLPVSPQQAVSYARPKFDKWLKVKSSR